MTPKPLGPFVLILVPIWVCHPEPIDGWLTSFHPNLIFPTPVCVCGGSSTTVLPSPLHPPPHCHHISRPTEMPETLLSEGHVTFQSPCPILMSNPDTSLPLVGAIIRIGVLLVISDQVQLRGLLGYVVIPNAAWILSLISEDNCCT